MTQHPRRLLLLAPIVHSFSLAELEIAPALLFVVDGRISWVHALPSLDRAAAEAEAAARGVKGVELLVVDEGFICPGFVDTHAHAPQFPNNGLGHGYQLLEWLEALTFPLERRFADETFAREVFGEVVRRTLAAGTTTSCYYSTLHVRASLVLAEACIAQGQRALVGRCAMDRASPENYVEASPDASMAATHDFLETFPSSALVKPVLTPRFALSCSPALLTALGKLAAETNLPVQTHISENPAEIAAVKKAFPDCDTYAGVYARFGLLNARTILAHGVHFDDAERAVVARAGAGVAHCPTSNTHLHSGNARVLALLDAGIRVGLGSDCSGGPCTGILSSLRAADAVSRSLTFEGQAKRSLSVAELFYMATRGGAEIAGFDAGWFKPGAEFDALWIRPRSPGMWIREGDGTREVFEKWLFAGDDRDIGAVWVAGRLVCGSAPAVEV